MDAKTAHSDVCRLRSCRNDDSRGRREARHGRTDTARKPHGIAIAIFRISLTPSLAHRLDNFPFIRGVRLAGLSYRLQPPNIDTYIYIYIYMYSVIYIYIYLFVLLIHICNIMRRRPLPRIARRRGLRRGVPGPAGVRSRCRGAWSRSPASG